MTRISAREREILEALRDGATLTPRGQFGRTFGLRRPGDRSWNGETVKRSTFVSLRTANLIDTSGNLTEFGRAMVADG